MFSKTRAFLLIGCVGIFVCGQADAARPTPKIPPGSLPADATAKVGPALEVIDQLVIDSKELGLSKILWSPDGKILAGVGGNSIQFWNCAADVITKGQKFDLDKAGGEATIPVAWSPDGKYLATAGSDALLRLYSVGDNEIKQLSANEGHDKPIYCVAFSHDGKTIASTGADMALILWDLKDGQISQRNTTRITRGQFGGKYIGFTQDDSKIMVATGIGEVNVFNVADGKPVFASDFKVPGVRFETPMAVSPSSDQVLFASQKEVKLWTERKSISLVAHDDRLRAVAWSPDAKFFASAGMDGRMIVWDQAGDTRYTLQRPSAFTDVKFKPADKDTKPGEIWVAALNGNGNIYVWHFGGKADVRAVGE